MAGATLRLEWPAPAHARIVIDRPVRHNALGLAELEALNRATCAAADGGARVVSLVAEGASFSVGGDVGAFAQALDAGAMAEWLREAGRHLNPAVARLRAMDAAVIVGAQGHVAGGAFGLLLAADLAIAADTLRIDTAYARLAASPDAGVSWFLPRVLGSRRAFEMLAFGTPLDAAGALELGMVNRIVAPEELRATVDAAARQLLDLAPVTLANFKRLVRDAHARSLGDHLEAEIAAFVEAAGGETFAARVRAFAARGRA